MKVSDLINLVDKNTMLQQNIKELIMKCIKEPKNTILKAKYKKAVEEYTNWLQEDIYF